MNDLHVNFTDQEAQSEARVFTPAPPGWYHCTIFDIEDAECGPESKNPGKPFWKITLQCVQDGEHNKRRFWDNIMLFNGALYSLAQLMKALGYDIKAENFVIPDSEDLLGQEILASVARVRDTYQMNKNGDGEVVFKNEVKGYKELDEKILNKIAQSGQGSSLLP